MDACTFLCVGLCHLCCCLLAVRAFSRDFDFLDVLLGVFYSVSVCLSVSLSLSGVCVCVCVCARVKRIVIRRGLGISSDPHSTCQTRDSTACSHGLITYVHDYSSACSLWPDTDSGPSLTCTNFPSSLRSVARRRRWRWRCRKTSFGFPDPAIMPAPLLSC